MIQLPALPSNPSALTRLLGTLAALVVVALVYGIDVATGPELATSVFYLLPVVAVGYALGKRSAGVVAIAAGFAWYAAQLPYHATTPQLLWTVASRFLTFWGMGLVVSLLRRERDRLLESNTELQRLLDRERSLSRTDAGTSWARNSITS